MNDALTSLNGTHELVWSLLEAGPKSKAATANLVVLATSSIENGPSARIVVLRHVDRVSGILRVFTHAASQKVADLNEDERAEIMIWDPVEQLQIRLTVNIEVSHVDSETWSRLGPGTRLNYAVDPTPGTPIEAPENARQATPEASQMLCLNARVLSIETLHITSDGLSRAVFQDGTSQWIAP
ncbi:MAG: hypothetical protein HKP54_03330 [Boseongicola sp.]|nr:hypothetical protein [Boseongicola sp.]